MPIEFLSNASEYVRIMVPLVLQPTVTPPHERLRWLAVVGEDFLDDPRGLAPLEPEPVTEVIYEFDRDIHHPNFLPN